MTRDNTPALLAASELRDVSLAPTAIRSANVTIIHPQLRDLVLPLGRGNVLYPHGTSVEEQRWSASDDYGSGDSSDYSDKDGGGKDKTFSSSSATRAAASAGALPRSARSAANVTGTTRELFKLSFTPTCLTSSGAILACGGQKGELFLCDLPQDGRMKRANPVKPFQLNMTLPNRSINNAITILPTWPNGWVQKQVDWKHAYAGYARAPQSRSGVDDDVDDLSESSDEDGEGDGDDDDDMELDDDDLGNPAVATYPNSLPFGHAPRMSGTGPGRRWSHGHNAPQYVTSHSSYGHHNQRHRSPVPSTTSSGHSRRSANRPNEPRILVSNNDQTVKMFSLRRVGDSSLPLPPPIRDPQWETVPAVSAMRQTQTTVSDPRYHQRTLDAAMSLPPGRSLFRSSYAYDSATLGLPSTSAGGSGSPTSGSSGMAGVNAYGAPHTAPAASEELSLRSSRYLGESPSAYRARNPAGDAALTARTQAAMRAREERHAEIERRMALTAEGVEPRKLSRIGGTKFKLAVNHSSLSPDLRTMVTVGDSTDVFLYEVIDGGREFRKIGVYNAATDSGFSTSWSKDGRKFAVASQDGQVTVWDHRTSRPLALFYSAPSTARWDYDDTLAHLAHDPVSSTSGREAARVVKFSPEGSDRDLLVFSEELTNIHIIDARTFHTHVVVPVPYEAPAPAPPAPERRTGVDSQTWGISGIAFDPTGDWLYAGTERTVVEWDLRRHGGGEGGTWSMA